MKITVIEIILFISLGIMLGGGVLDDDGKAIADPISPYSQRSLQYMQDIAKATERQAAALETISRKLGICECECED